MSLCSCSLFYLTQLQCWQYMSYETHMWGMVTQSNKKLRWNVEWVLVQLSSSVCHTCMLNILIVPWLLLQLIDLCPPVVWAIECLSWIFMSPCMLLSLHHLLPVTICVKCIGYSIPILCNLFQTQYWCITYSVSSLTLLHWDWLW